MCMGMIQIKLQQVTEVTGDFHRPKINFCLIFIGNKGYEAPG